MSYPTVNPEEMIVRGIYRLRSRNLRAGVWDGHVFIGLREKFGELRLDSEQPNTEGALGTVFAAERLDLTMAEGIELRTHLDSKCSACGAATRFQEWTEAERERERETASHYVGLGRWLCECENWWDAQPGATPNIPLYEALVEIERGLEKD